MYFFSFSLTHSAASEYVEKEIAKYGMSLRRICTWKDQVLHPLDNRLNIDAISTI